MAFCSFHKTQATTAAHVNVGCAENYAIALKKEMKQGWAVQSLFNTPVLSGKILKCFQICIQT